MRSFGRAEASLVRIKRSSGSTFTFEPTHTSGTARFELSSGVGHLLPLRLVWCSPMLRSRCCGILACRNGLLSERVPYLSK